MSCQTIWDWFKGNVWEEETLLIFLLLLFSPPCCASYSAGWPGWHNGRRCPIKVQMLHHIKSAGHTGGLVTSGTYSFCCCCQFSEITVKVEGLKLSEAQTSNSLCQWLTSGFVALWRRTANVRIPENALIIALVTKCVPLQAALVPHSPRFVCCI